MTIFDKSWHDQCWKSMAESRKEKRNEAHYDKQPNENVKRANRIANKEMAIKASPRMIRGTQTMVRKWKYIDGLVGMDLAFKRLHYLRKLHPNSTLKPTSTTTTRILPLFYMNSPGCLHPSVMKSQSHVTIVDVRISVGSETLTIG
ncbi:hypothetical protein CBL_03080 [Carabus blaptoides fortunei]